MTTVTKQNQSGINTFYHVSKTNTTGRLKVRRNGVTKVWKTRPEEFQIPVKYGLYEYGYITEATADQWAIE